MRTTREVTAQSRQRIVDTAARLLRRRGLETSIVDVMTAAGMTHGGFYKHFPSKDALANEAVRAAFQEIADRFDARAQAIGEEAARKAYAAEYLSQAHLEHPEAGCPVAALGADAGRRQEAFSPAFREGIEALIERLGGPRLEQRADAIRRLTSLLGATIAARAVGPGTLREEILAACAQ